MFFLLCHKNAISVLRYFIATPPTPHPFIYFELLFFNRDWTPNINIIANKSCIKPPLLLPSLPFMYGRIQSTSTIYAVLCLWCLVMMCCVFQHHSPYQNHSLSPTPLLLLPTQIHTSHKNRHEECHEYMQIEFNIIHQHQPRLMLSMCANVIKVSICMSV